jgi:O-methyltransferase involved in polyketide biosynthesis
MSQQIDSPVCRTAIVMAAKRAIENERDDRLFDDPFAAQLAGRDAIQQQLDYHKTLDPRNQLKGSWQLLVISLGGRQRAEGRRQKSERYN